MSSPQDVPQAPVQASAQAVIFGCSGPALSEAEQRFFTEANPHGFILFARNCQTPDQIRRLVDDLRSSVARHDAPVLIDQEGGRVARLTPPHWRAAPAAALFGKLAETDPEKAARGAFINARLLAVELAELGIDVDCAPVLDLGHPGGDPVIGDRAFSNDPQIVGQLGKRACEGFIEGGILPVIKHIPGHGRALCDSHLALPVVDDSLETLDSTDFEAFRALAHMPWAMTAHVVYSAIDPDHPATTSKIVIDEIIRRRIGFGGVLISDDLSMKALSGAMRSRAEDSLSAGCDLVLHCNGEMAEMEEVAAGCGPVNDRARARIDAANSIIKPLQAIDKNELIYELNVLLEGAG